MFKACLKILIPEILPMSLRQYAVVSYAKNSQLNAKEFRYQDFEACKFQSDPPDF